MSVKLTKTTNHLTKLIEKDPNKVVERLTMAMNAIINGMAADLERRKLLKFLPALTQHGGANDELVASDGTNLVTEKEVGGVTDAIEDAIKDALYKGEVDKAERLQAMLARQTAIVAAKKMSKEARRIVSAAAAAEEGKERRETVEFIRNNIVQGARYAGGVSIAWMITKLIYAVPRLVSIFTTLLGSYSVAGLVNMYNAVLASTWTAWMTGAEPINSTEFYNGLVTDITSSEIGKALGQESDNLFYLIMIINFAVVVCFYIIIKKVSEVKDVRVLPGVGVSFSGRELPTPNSERNAALIFRAAEQAAAQALGSSGVAAQALGSSAAAAQAVGSSAAAAQALGSSPATQALEGPTIEEVSGGGSKNKRKRRKSRKQQKSKKSKKSHKSHKQQKSRKKQRKSRKNLKFKKTRK